MSNDIRNKIYSTWITSNHLYYKLAEKAGISYQEFIILYGLSNSESIQQKDICRDYAIPKQTISTMISKLEKKGILTLETDRNDRRAKRIKLTDYGFEYASSKIKPIVELESSVIAVLGEDRIQLMNEINEAFNIIMEKKMEELQ